MASWVIALELIWFLGLLFQSAFAQLALKSERTALLGLRTSLGLRSRDWPRKADPCTVWIGVQCRSDGRVVGINVSDLQRTRRGRLDPRFAVDSLTNLTQLTHFNASGFSLPGQIPDLFGQKLVKLQVLDLSSCSITGPIPTSLGNLANLSVLDLSRNTINGVIPSTLGLLSRLIVLDLSKNLITGSIPLSFSSINKLTLIDLSSNSLSGSIPPSLGTLSNLQFLNLSNNSLSGSIPVQLGGLSRLVEIDLSLNSLSGGLDDSLFSGLFRVQTVVFSHNGLTGGVPDALWRVPGLRFLDISYNNFTGILPNLSSNANFGYAVFNLSNNQFYGVVGLQLGRFSFIDLSSNYFQGKIIGEIGRNSSLTQNCLKNSSNQRTLEDCKLFYSDKGVQFDSFDSFGAPNVTVPTTSDSSKTSNRKLTFILVGVLGGVGFVVVLVLCLVFCLYKCRKDVGQQRGTTVSPGPPAENNLGFAGRPINFSGLGEAFTYEQILLATGDFSDSNLIKQGHSGDLFRGILGDGASIVVKRIDVPSKKDSYMVELSIFSKASHTRLVPFLGHCLEKENEKFLVYKRMPNGDLLNSLYRKPKEAGENPQSLDWITRLKIAIGAAEGLSYLHHECSPPIVHRDVQASSILLDDKFEVRLGSFSEACAQEGDSHPNVISRFLRRPQTSEQGPSGNSSATCSYDVHCFGKVLLELVTGKLGIGKSDEATVNEWLEHTLPCISMYEKELMMKIIDPSLIIDEDLLEEVWAMAIVAKSCLNPKPSKRPLMKYILKALENPLKVVREENSSSGRLRTTSSRRSWNASIFGSWRHSSSEIIAFPGSMREGPNASKQSAVAFAQGEHSASNKRLSNDVYPEDLLELERPKDD
ncbi:hypothetical protein Scep_020635 [Stephania cephalantha]|uniref:Protein kinase domain-containing protein n=1 Tax=Stephania cephalantha TaxID=152367 RepID=A0AAP0IE36_9MAGN